MSAASGQSAAAPSLRRLPFTVSIAPSFANPLISAPAQEPSEIEETCGLLFGIRDSGSVLVKRNYPFSLRKAGGGEEHGFEAGLMAAQQETELKALSPVGWYVRRATGGLLESDIELHNRHFPKATDLAIVVRPEGVNEVICEIYSRSVEGLLSEEGHRWGLLRMTRQKLLEAAAEVTMRAQMRDDFFMRAYDQPEEASSEEAAPAIWRRALDRLRRSPKGQAVAREPLLDLGSTIPAKKPSPLYDPSDDATREMPRELAFKALGLDASVVTPASLAKTEAHKPPAAPPNQRGTSADVGADREPVVLRSLSGDNRLTAAPQHDLQPITAERPRLPARDRASFSISRWLTTAAVFSVAAAATFAVIHYRVLPGSFVSTTGASSPLGLKLEGQGDRILVTWNRKGDAALGAVNGQLAIDDGAQHKTLTLDPTQILTGSVLYRPNSADVTFRLQMTDSRGKQLEETLRVLDASRTNNDGIKAISVDGATAPSTQSIPKAPATRKGLGGVAPANGVVPVDSTSSTTGNDISRDVSIQSELPSAAPPAESPRPAEPEKAVGNASAAQSAPEPTAEAPSETVADPPPPTAKEAVKVFEKPGVPDTPAAIPASPLRQYYAPKPARQVMPNLRALPPALAAADAQVEIRVSIDGQGRVLAARVTNTTGKANSALSNAALMAARRWTFSPATMNGQAVPSEHAIVFNFKPASR